MITEVVRAHHGWKTTVLEHHAAIRAIKDGAIPEGMSGTLIYHCSPETGFVTGQMLVVDGGSVTR